MAFDWWAVTGWVMTLGGFCLSLFALFVADDAKKAVAKALRNRNEQGNRDEARELLIKLNAAKDAALARRASAAPLLSRGRSLPSDMRALTVAQDACATAVLAGDQELTMALQRTATQLIDAIDAINGIGDRDGWADAQVLLQGVAPRVDAYQRKLGTKALLGE